MWGAGAKGCDHRENFHFYRKAIFFLAGKLFGFFLWRTDLTQRLNFEARKKIYHTFQDLKVISHYFFPNENLICRACKTWKKIPPMMTQYFFSPSVKFAMSHFLTLSSCIGKMMATAAPLYSFFLRSSSISISLAFLPTFHNCLYGRRKGGKDC